MIAGTELLSVIKPRSTNPTSEIAMNPVPLSNGTTSRERVWGWSKPREASSATRKEGTG
jgi:hypothetical protein